MIARSRALPLTVATAFFMEGLDSSVVTTALPAMAHDFGTTIPELAAAVTAYLISLAVFMPLGGWLSDRYGGRRVFIAAVAIFAVGSLFCGLAQTSLALILGRIVQGIGGAMMAPVGRAVLVASVPKSDYLRAMNYVIIPGLIGPAAGPLVGGFLSTYASWHWIFLVNLPLAALGIAMAIRFMPKEVPDNALKCAPLDWIGYCFLVVTLGVGQGAIEMFGHGAAPLFSLLAMLVSITAGALFYMRFKRIGSGVIDLGLFRVRTLRLSISAGSVARAGLGGVPFLLPLLLQVVFGYDPFQSGLVTFVVAIGSAAIRPITSFALKRLGCRQLLLVNSFVTAAGLAGFVLFRDGSQLWLMSPYVFVVGLLRSIQMSTTNALSYTDIDKAQMSRAATLSTLAQRLSIGLGVSIAATVLRFASEGAQPDLNAFAVAFVVSAMLVLVAGAMFLELRPTDGWQISNRPEPEALRAQRAQAENAPVDV